jgi:SH3 domain-containing protein
MKLLYTLISVIIIIGLNSCDNESNNSNTEIVSDFDYSGTIKEVIQTSNYTYCFVADDKNEHWIAISKADLNVGETLYFNQGLEMKDFHSKELDRTFPSVFFVQKASTEPNSVSMQMPATTKPVKPEIIKKVSKVEKATDGITIEKLFSNINEYNGQVVKVRGKVTKLNEGILGMNWIHIQDGTEYDGNFDLTVTTLESVNVDAVVTFEGTIATNKDFGAGYSYSVIMEQAVIVK